MNEISKKVTKRAKIVGIGTLASRILGLVRESVIAAYFPKEVIDAYQIAFMIPNSFRRLTAEGSFSISVTSVFSKIWANNNQKESQDFARATTGFALMFLLGLTILGILGAEGLTYLAGHGFSRDPQKFELATSLTKTMFPYIFFISLTALAMGFLNSTGRFFAPAFAPVLLNISIIGCAVGFSGSMPFGLNPIFSLALGVLIGGIAQLILQLPSLKSVGLLKIPTINLRHPKLKRVLLMTLPMVFGAAVYQIGIFISNSIASTLGDGAVTYIQFSQRLVELPIAVLVMAISTAALPSLATMKGADKLDEMKKIYGYALRLALFVATPSMVALICLAEPIITVMYQRGLFSHADVINTAAALRWTAAGICSIALLRQTVPVFYAIENIKIPVIMSFVFVVVLVAAAMVLKEPFGYLGLCMALSIATTVQAVGLVIVLNIKLGSLGIKRILSSWTRVSLATIPMGIAVYYTSILGNWEKGGNSFLNIAVLLLSVVIGIMVYAVFSFIMRVPELKELLNIARRQKQ